jgi:hypothetical protein
MLPFNVKDILSGKTEIRLQREDKIHIYPITSLREAYSVTINGEVNRPATFTFADNMRVQDLILLADGFKEGASRSRIEVSRRLSSTSKSDTTAYSIIQTIDLDPSSIQTDSTGLLSFPLFTSKGIILNLELIFMFF